MQWILILGVLALARATSGQDVCTYAPPAPIGLDVSTAETFTVGEEVTNHALKTTCVRCTCTGPNAITCENIPGALIAGILPCIKKCFDGERSYSEGEKFLKQPTAYTCQSCECMDTGDVECDVDIRNNVDGSWSEWSEAGDCSVSCGTGKRGYVRSCDNPAPDCDGKPCGGDTYKESSCTMPNPCPCEYDGQEVPFGEEVTNHADRECSVCICGQNSEIQCSPRTGAKQDGQWTAPVDVGSCSVACGGEGVQAMEKTCDPAKCGGADCVGLPTSTRPCNEGACPPCDPPCHDDATCSGIACSCNAGFLGDGVELCKDSCKCTIRGDPMVVSYDGDWGLIEGTGNYTASESTVFGGCDWRIVADIQEVDNRRTIVRVHIHRGGHVYQLSDSEVKIDDVATTPPFSGYGCNIDANGGDGFMFSNDACSLRVTFGGQGLDATSQITVGNATDYQGLLSGMCGSCDGDSSNDIKLPDGSDIGDLTDPNRFQTWSDSWIAT